MEAIMYSVRDNTKTTWQSGRAGYNPGSATLAELMSGAMGIPLKESQDLIAKLGGERLLRHASLSQLLGAGIATTTATRMMALIEFATRFNAAPTPTVVDDPAKAAEALSYHLAGKDRERFAVLLLDVQHHLLSVEVISTGTATECLANPREIFTTILRGGATRAIVAHNHPTGKTNPSPEDLVLTRAVLQGAKTLAIPILDHLIIGTTGYTSLRTTTNLWDEIPQND